MELKPVKKTKSKLYPTGAMYQRSLNALLATAVAGLGVAAYGDIHQPNQSIFVQEGMVIEIDDDDDNEAVAKKPELTQEQKVEFEKIKLDVKATKAELGADSFKTRRDATSKLIAIGTLKRLVDDPAKKDKKKSVAPYLDLVTEELQDLLKHKDPEVAERARKIIAAITPKPPVRPPFRGGGAVAW